MSDNSEIIHGNNIQRMPPPLYGLVLQTASSSVASHRVSQLYRLLDAHCEFAFLAGRRPAEDLPAAAQFPTIINSTSEADLLQTLLATMRAGPQAAWLVVHASMQNMDARTIAHLIVNRNPDKWATAYMNGPDGLPNAFCAIYEPAIRARLVQLAKSGCASPQDALIQMPEQVELLVPLNPDALAMR